MRPLGVEHNHIKSLRYFTIRPRGKKFYGGSHPVKDLKFRDEVHLSDFELNQFLGCLSEIAELFLGPRPPQEVVDLRLSTNPQMKFKF